MKTGLSPLSFGHTPGHSLLIRGINSPCLSFSQREESSRKAFTLVELIVVITILAILGTIAFVSIQSYTVYARDSVRLSNLRTIESSLKIQYTQGGAYAVPDDSVNITASGTLIRKQGVFGKQALRTVKLNSDASEDPLTGESYDYIVDNNLSEYQLVGYMEGDEAYNPNPLSGAKGNQVPDKGFRVIDNTFANTGSTLKTLGQDLGIVFSGGVAVHRESANVGNNIEIMNATGNLNIVFDEGDETGYLTGSLLFSNVYNRSRALLKNKELAKLDESLVLYFDMETTTMSGSLKVLKDFSKYGNNGACYTDYNNVDCDSSYQDMVKQLGFEETASYIDIPTSFSGISTYSLLLDTQIYGNHDFYNGTIISSGNWNNVNKWGLGVRQDNGGPAIFPHAYYNLHQVIPTNHILNLGLRQAGGGLELFFDGVKKKSFPVDDVVFSSHLSNTYIGKANYGYNTRYFSYNGGIYNIRFYNRALSEKEIKTIYGSTLK